MNRTLAPSWLPRQRRRHIDRQLRKLIRPGVCSLCGSPLKHNSCTAGGLDSQGNVVLAGECCTDQVAAIFVRGLYNDRKYDFLLPRGPEPSGESSNEQIANAIASYQEVITETDKRLDGIERRGGVTRPLNVSVLDTPWKDDDRCWFEQNRKRSHRARMPFPGELGGDAAAPPAGHVPIMLVRQVEPGSRIRARLFLDVVSLPVPDDEAVIHTLFEIATGREALPPDIEAFGALIEKYKVAKTEWRRQ